MNCSICAFSHSPDRAQIDVQDPVQIRAAELLDRAKGTYDARAVDGHVQSPEVLLDLGEHALDLVFFR